MGWGWEIPGHKLLVTALLQEKKKKERKKKERENQLVQIGDEI